MIESQLLTEQLTWLKYVPGAQDAYGVPVEAWVDQQIPIPAYVEQTASVEVLQGRDTVTADWLVVTSPKVKVSAYDRLIVRGRTLEVLGDPAMFHSPQGDHHTEIRARGISG